MEIEKLRLHAMDSEVPASIDSEVYTIHDRPHQFLTYSTTVLKPGKQTRGHDHSGQEEIYFFVAGFGEMIMRNLEGEEERFGICAGDHVFIPDGWFHQVINKRLKHELKFYCVFNGAPGRPKQNK